MYYGRETDFEAVELSIDIINDGAISTGNVYSQPQKTGVLYNAYLIKPKFQASEKLLHFFTTSIYRSIKHKYGYENKAGWEKVKKESIQLPTKNGAIDFDFMESFIAELEQERMQTLQAYLQATGLDNYELTKEEEKALEEYEKLEFADFKVKESFQILTYKKRFDANKIELSLSNTGHPYVVRTSLNNGVKGYINEDIKYLNDGNTISFGQDTATMFYQERPYFTGDKIKIMKSRSKEFNKLNAQYFITSMNKTFSSFSWGGSSFSVSIIESQKVLLPQKGNEPDYKIMELIVSAIQKLVIKDVVQYTQKKLTTI